MAPALPQNDDGFNPGLHKKSTHLQDPNLQPFLSADFDPAEFLNSSLPALSVKGPQARTGHMGGGTLSEVSASTQNTLSTLNAHLSRLSNTLNQLTDEILRSGSRLAYEVEVLRGDASGLSETLTGSLDRGIRQLLPDGLPASTTQLEQTSQAPSSPDTSKAARRRSSTRRLSEGKTSEEQGNASPPYVRQLRTLCTVRDRLDNVVKIFGEALEWTIPPSEVSVASSFISVSAPEPGSESASREEKGHQIGRKLQDEVSTLLADSADEVGGLEKATEKVARLRELANLWKGTSEEKARLKFTESLVKMLEERQRSLVDERAKEQKGQSSHPGEETKSSSALGRQTTASSTLGPDSRQGYTFIDQLQRLRSGL